MFRPALIFTLLWLLLGQTLLHAGWTGATRVGSTVYLFDKTAGSLNRYDLDAGQWLPVITLPTTHGFISATSVDEDGIYIAFNKSVFRYDHTLANERLLFTAATQVREIVTDGNLLFLNISPALNLSLVSIDKDTQAVLDTFQGTGGYTINKLSRSANILITNQSEMTHCGVLAYQNDGTFVEPLTSIDTGTDFRKGAWLLEDDSQFIDPGGTIRSATAPYPVVREVGRKVSNAASIPGRGFAMAIDPYGVAVYSEDFTLREQVPFHSRIVVSFFIHDEKLIVFFATGEPAILPLDSLFDPATNVPPDPATAIYSAESIFRSNDGIIHLFSKTHRTIFRWDPVTQSYLTSIPLLGPSLVAYSPHTHSIFTAYPSRLIRKIDLADPGLGEQPFGYVANVPWQILSVGDCLLATASSTTTQTPGSNGIYEILGPDGKSTAIKRYVPFSWCYWNETAQEVYATYRQPGFGTDISALRIGAGGAASADLPHGTFAPQSRSNGIFDSNFPPQRYYGDPVVVSPDGNTLVCGSGLVLDRQTLKPDLNRIPVFDSGSWSGSRFTSLLSYPAEELRKTTTVRATDTPPIGGNLLTTTLTGSPLEILPLPDGKNLVTTDNGPSVSFYILGENLEIIPPEVISAPSSLSWTLTTDKKVQLSWRDVAGETSYRVERRTLFFYSEPETFPWTLLGTTVDSTFTDSEVEDTNDYEYRITAVNGEIESQPSEPFLVRYGTPRPPVTTAVLDSATTARISWEPVAEATSYSVYYRTFDSNGYIGTQLPASQTSILHEGLIPGRIYQYTVVALNSFGNSGYNDPAEVTTSPAPPFTPPIHLTSPSNAELTRMEWMENPLATGYRIERRIVGHEWETLFTGLGATWWDYTVQPLTQYEYRFTAFNDLGDSPNPRIATRTTPDLPLPETNSSPPRLRGKPTEGPAILLSWIDTRYEREYLLERRTDTTGWQTLGHPPSVVSASNQMSWTDTTVEPGTHYTYRLTATNSKGSIEIGTLRIEAADNPTIITDDFEPGIDPSMWTETGTATVVESGTPGNHALRIDGQNTRQVITREADFSLGGTIRFKFRGSAGSTLPIYIRIASTGYDWGEWLTIHPDAEGFSGWKTYQMEIYPNFITSPSRLFIGTDITTPGLPWEIDDIEVSTIVPHSAPEPVTDFSFNEAFASYHFAQRVPLRWQGTYGASSYVIERRTADSPWTVVGEHYTGLNSGLSLPTAFTDKTRASTEYFYRIIAKNPGGLSAPSHEIRVVTHSAWQQWRTANFPGSLDPDESSPLADRGTGVPNLLNFAFNINVGGDPYPNYEDREFSGMPAIHRDAESGLLRVEFFRRREDTNPETDYIVEFSDDCKTWELGGRQVEAISALAIDMEKVIWEDTPPPNASPVATRFARVRVTQR